MCAATHKHSKLHVYVFIKLYQQKLQLRESHSHELVKAKKQNKYAV